MGWSFPGIAFPVECQYTQTRGVHPDAVLMYFLPQPGNVPASGTLTLSWSAATVTLPNCVVDKDTLGIGPDGIFHTIVAWDRRERWKYAAPVSGYYNTVRAGSAVTASRKSLRELCVLLLQAMGETSPTVSSVPNDVYPQVRWLCDAPRLALESLLNQYGLDLCLGFGAEAVSVVHLGTGASLPSTGQFISSLTVDPRIHPRYVRVCFGESRMQARFLLEAVGIEPDLGTWELIDGLTYTPLAGWGAEDPYTLPTVKSVGTEEEYAAAINTVFRAYRIKNFADDSLNLPNGSGTLTSIEEVLPLISSLLQTEDPRLSSRRPFRIFGEHYMEVREKGQPATGVITPVDAELTHYRVFMDAESGMIIFEEPVFTVTADQFAPAELYLECTFGLTTPSNNAPVVYTKDVDFDLSGFGYVTLQKPELSAEVVVTYDSEHNVTGSIDNQTALDSVAALEAAAVAASLTGSLAQVKVYNQPVLSIRLDGAVTQVRHVMTNGEKREAVNRTVASSNTEFDRNIPSRRQRASYLNSLLASYEASRATNAIRRRGFNDE